MSSGGWITISSGYRSPSYNKHLRDKGRTVAKASLHQYGMAVDMRIEGVSAKRTWLYARKRQLGGAGFYSSPWVHIDVGPARFWTQTTANVRGGKSDHNKSIIIVPRYDIYEAGETLHLRFARMTAFPIGISPVLTLESAAGDQLAESARSVRLQLGKRQPRCALFENAEQLAHLPWQIPRSLGVGRYRLRAKFCKRRWPAMPAEISSYPFELR